ncbi:MAG: tyrosine-type recombinase/integrase, partial [Xanthomonadales bacterium]|nr:tyrosine-type recombinase/integrase [Xanthomonadales bacterium]
SFMVERRYAECTAHRYQRMLADYACWLAVRRRRLAELEAKDVLHIVRYHSIGRCTTCREERRAALNVWLQFTGRARPAATPAPWQGWLDVHLRFLADHKGLVASTLEYRRLVIGSYLTWQFGRRPVDWSRVGPKDVLAYTHELAGGHLRRNTLKVQFSAFRQFLRFLVIRGVGSPALVEAVPSVSTHGQAPARPTVLTEEQRRKLLGAFPRRTPVGRRNYAMTICMIDLGLRISEIIALRLGSVDRERHLLTVPGVKCGRGRTLPLPRRVEAALVAYIQKGRPESDCLQLFLSDPKRRGTALSVGAARMQVVRTFRRCGFPASWCGVHRLRHTFAS